MKQRNDKNRQIRSVKDFLVNLRKLALLIIFASVLFNTSSNGINAQQNIRTKILVSINPLQLILSEILPVDKFEITAIENQQKDIHSAELLFSDQLKIYNSDLVVLNGYDLEPWGKTIKDKFRWDKVKGEEKKIYEFFGECLHSDSKSNNNGENSDHHNRHKEEEKECDPHRWLDLDATGLAVENFYNFICGNDRNIILGITAEDCSLIYKKVSLFKEKTAKLKIIYQDNFSKIPNNTFVATHSTFISLANAFGLKELAVSSGCETSDIAPSKLFKVHDFIKANNVLNILCEDKGENSDRLQLTVDNKLQCINVDSFGYGFKPLDFSTALENPKRAKTGYFDYYIHVLNSVVKTL